MKKFMARKNNDSNKLFQILNNKSFSSEFIAGIAGDHLQSEEDKNLFDMILSETGDDVYVKLLFHLTCEVFEKNRAAQLWREILQHKKDLSKQLDRNVEITVATLDYLTNIKREIESPKIIGEAFLGKIAEISSVDALTKLFNRQHLNQILTIEFARFRRYSTQFSILLIDIDNFKTINDRYGHQAGDGVLIDISRILTSDLRELDVCTRYGGEEFIIVLPHTGEDEAYDIAERIRLKTMTFFDSTIHLTISLGLATITPNMVSVVELIKIADEALYASKASGRNRTTRGAQQERLAQ